MVTQLWWVAVLAATLVPPLRAAPPAARSFPLSAAEEQRTFQLSPGFHVELVAAEPLVHDPVAVAYDRSGNLWVLEMTRFNSGMVKDLPQLAHGVTAVPSSKLVKLESSRGDGHYDRRVVWLDGLNAPRAFAIVHDGILVDDPPNLWLARDLHGTGKCDDKVLLADHFGVPLINESNANGLVWGRDNILHTICFDQDYRYRQGKLTPIAVDIRGEFGLAQDDYGRLFFNRNSDQLRADLYAPRYATRNPTAEAPWANYQTALSQEVWPGHPTPVLNRGYRKGELGKETGGVRDDGTLMEFTAACGPQIYRGANFGASFYGNAFVPEPSANMIKRNLLRDNEGIIKAVNAYLGREFLTSTDQWFRPVALVNAPDGCLTIVDFYRGVLEEYHLITPYLRDQTLAHGLDAPMFGQGRIWKIVRDDGPRETTRPNLDAMTSRGLVSLLENPNSWWRDTAQQEIVERGDASAVPALAELFDRAASPIPRVYALWTLDGLGALAVRGAEGRAGDVFRRALADPSPKVRGAAIRVGERFLGGADEDEALALLVPLAHDPAPEVAVQLALSLGDAKGSASLDGLADVLHAAGAHPFTPAAIVASLYGREVDFLDKIAADLPAESPPEIKAVIELLSAGVARGGNQARIQALVARAGDAGGLRQWARLAVIEGLGEAGKAANWRTGRLPHPMKASALAPLTASADPAVRAAAQEVGRRLARIEQQRLARATAGRPLTPPEQKLAEAGKVTFQICAGCHQPAGTGLPNVAPSLVDSPLVVGNPESLVRIVLNGKEGTPGFPGAMPPIAITFSDEQIAGVLTYVRNSWGLRAGAVSLSTVAKIRAQVGTRQAAWTNAELAQIEIESAKAEK